MRKNNDVKYKNNFIFRIFILFCVVITIMLIAMSFLCTLEKHKNYKNVCYAFTNGWEYVDGDGNVGEITTFPGKVDTKSNILTLKTVLDKSYDYKPVIMLYSRHQLLHVYVENKCIYKLENNVSLSKSPGCGWHFINIDEDMYGKEIRITYENVYEKHHIGEYEEIYIGNGTGVLSYLIQVNFVSVIISFVIIGLSFMLFAVYKILKNYNEKRSMLFLSVFAFILGVYSLIETDVAQLFVNNIGVLSIITYEALMTVSIPLLLYFREESEENYVKVVVNMLLGFGCIVFAALHFLQYTHRAEFPQTLWIVHISMVLYIIGIITVSIVGLLSRKSVLGRKYADKLAYLILGASVIMDVIRFYEGGEQDYAFCTRIGIIFFVVVLAVSVVNNVYNVSIMGEKVDLWDKFAHEDVLTGTLNRAAFEEEMHDVMRNQSDDSKVAIISIDVNNLKKINDTYGHAEGDIYLKECIYAIREAIGKETNLYRIGGDEFIIIIRNFKSGQVMKIITDFEKILRTKHEKYMYPVSFAYGYAYFKASQDKDIYDTLKRADTDMYAKKTEMKKKIDYQVVL